MYDHPGNAATLVASHPNNSHAAKHAVYSPRLREPRAQEIARQVLEAPHTISMDEIGAMEIGRVVALIESLDAALADAGPVNGRKGTVRALVELRLRASRRLEAWLDAYGLTPKGRAGFVKTLTSASVADELRRRIGEGNGGA